MVKILMARSSEKNLRSTRNLLGLATFSSFLTARAFCQTSSIWEENSAYLRCRMEQISRAEPRSLILSLASTRAAATSPMYLVRLRALMSFLMTSFWASV